MSNIGVCHNRKLVTTMLILRTILLLLLTCRVGGRILTEQTSPLELSSRDELVEIAGYGEQKLSTVLVTGTLFCNPPSLPKLRYPIPTHPTPISGALVAVVCEDSAGKKRESGREGAEAVTDEYGEFVVDIPSHLHAIPHLDKACSVRVLRIPRGSLCRPSHVDVKKSRGLTLSSSMNGIRTYTCGDINLLHSTTTARPAQA